MSWHLKSESDTDRVYVEVNDQGVETGSYRYEFKGRKTVQVEKPRRRWTPAYAALGGATAVVAVELARQLF